MLSVLVSIALSQAATTPTRVPEVPVEVVAPQQPRRVCRIERNTGSRVQARRVCQTVSEREHEQEENQRTAADGTNRDWDRRQIDRLNEPVATSFGPPMGGVTGQGAGPR